MSLSSKLMLFIIFFHGLPWLLLATINNVVADPLVFKYYPPPDTGVNKLETESKLMLIDEQYDRIYFTGVNKLYSASLDLTDVKEHDLTPTEEELAVCRNLWRTDVDQHCHCKNHIKILEFDLDGNVYACGTYAFDPKCFTFTRGDNGLTKDKVSPGYNRSPNFYNQNATAVFTSPYYMVATQGKDDFAIRKFLPSSKKVKLNTALDKSHVFSSPHFVSSYSFENTNYTYFFFYESAVENTERESIYSRVGRVCKHDQGDDLDNNVFATFLKSQLKCYKKGKMLNSYYDELRSTQLVNVHESGSDKSTQFIYAVFATADGLGGSALCRYKVTDIINLFETSPVFKLEDGSWSKVEMNDDRAKLSRPKCDGPVTAQYNNKEFLSAKDEPLLYDDIVPYDGQALYIDKTKSLTSIAVDDVHLLSDASDIGTHVVFMGTQNGEIVKVALNSTGKSSAYFIEALKPFKGDEPIYSLKNSKGMVYAGSTPGVANFEVQRCDNQLVCSSCVQLKDPYCAWSPSLKKCAVAKSLQDDDRLMDLFKGDASICPKVKSSFSCNITINELTGTKASLQCLTKATDTNIKPQIIQWNYNNEQITHSIDTGVLLTPNTPSHEQSLNIYKYPKEYIGNYECIIELDGERKNCRRLIEVAITTTTTTVNTNKIITTENKNLYNIGDSTIDRVNTPMKTTPFTPPSPVTLPVNDPEYYDKFQLVLILLIVLLIMFIALICVLICVFCCCCQKQHSSELDGSSKTNGYTNNHFYKLNFAKKKYIFNMNRKDSASKELVKKQNRNQVYKDTTVEMDDLDLVDEKNPMNGGANC